jgi:hypothetical protein
MSGRYNSKMSRNPLAVDFMSKSTWSPIPMVRQLSRAT